MQNISNPPFTDESGGRFRAIAGAILLVTVVLIGGRHIAAEEEPRTIVVLMENMNFSPSVLRVRVGDRIEFKNRDLVPHTATAKAAGGFDSGVVSPGESWFFAPTHRGTFNYTCAFHPMMAGKLVVAAR